MKKAWINIVTAALIAAVPAGALAGTHPVKKVDSARKIANADPYIRQVDGKVFLNYLNLTERNVRIRVWDEEGRILYSEDFRSPVVEKAFNFESAEKGTYRVELVVEDGERTLSETFRVVR